MLKKLVKYGNSNALVLDKPVLELLDMGEGSVVKIKTDGKSLIITPHSPNPQKKEKISPSVSYFDALQNSLLNQTIEHYANVPHEKKELLVEELKALTLRRMQLAENSPAFKQFTGAIQDLLKKHSNKVNSPEFQQEYILLRDKLVPELKDIDDQGADLEKKYGLINKNIQQPPLPPEDAEKMRDAYQDLFKKHATVQQKLMQLAENPEYIHEMQLIAEKYSSNIMSAECNQESLKIRYRYVPEAQAMDQDLHKIGEQFLTNPGGPFKR